MNAHPQFAPIPPNERTLALILGEFGIPIEDNLDRRRREVLPDDGDAYWLQDGKLRRRVDEYVRQHAAYFGGTLAGMHLGFRKNAHFPSTKATPDWDAIARILSENESAADS